MDTREGMVSKRIPVKATLLSDIRIINISKLYVVRYTITFVWRGSSKDMLHEKPSLDSSFF